MMLYAVDPDTKLSGVATFCDGILIAVALTNAPIVGVAPCRCVAELCEVQYGRTKDPRDIIQLALAAGKICANLETKWLTRSQWGGQLPKAIWHNRMWEELTPPEKKVVESLKCTKDSLLDIYDAVTIGLVELGRLGRAARRA
jgi:hypothetical protein